VSEVTYFNAKLSPQKRGGSRICQVGDQPPTGVQVQSPGGSQKGASWSCCPFLYKRGGQS